MDVVDGPLDVRGALEVGSERPVGVYREGARHGADGIEDAQGVGTDAAREHGFDAGRVLLERLDEGEGFGAVEFAGVAGAAAVPQDVGQASAVRCQVRPVQAGQLGDAGSGVVVRAGLEAGGEMDQEAQLRVACPQVIQGRRRRPVKAVVELEDVGNASEVVEHRLQFRQEIFRPLRLRASEERERGVAGGREGADGARLVTGRHEGAPGRMAGGLAADELRREQDAHAQADGVAQGRLAGEQHLLSCHGIGRQEADESVAERNGHVHEMRPPRGC